LAAFGEAAVTPSERLQVLAGLTDDDWDTPFADAIAELIDYHLIEPLGLKEGETEGTAFRLHPLTQVYAARTLNAHEKLQDAVPRLVATYRDPTTWMLRRAGEGLAAVMDDLRVTQAVLKTVNDELNQLTRLLALEESHLLAMPEEAQKGYVIQQVREPSRIMKVIMR